ERPLRQRALIALTVISTRLIDDRRRHRGHAGDIQFVPEPTTDALGDEKITLAVDAFEDAPSLGNDDGAMLIAGQVTEFEQHIRDAVEHLGHRAGAGLDLATQLIRLLLEAPPAFSPAS